MRTPAFDRFWVRHYFPKYECNRAQMRMIVDTVTKIPGVKFAFITIRIWIRMDQTGKFRRAVSCILRMLMIG
jgi:hypothetical protein